MIFLEKPYIKTTDNKSRLIFEIKIGTEEKMVWFEVDKDYSKYLCDDRIDSILIGLLSYAMRNGHDFESNSYITEDLLFKLNEYLIPTLAKYSKSLKKININIKTKPAIKNAGAVGTGCSCGIDSIHAILTKSSQKIEKYNITHLCINNVGAFNECYKQRGIEVVREEVINKAKLLSQKIGLPLVVTDSNFLEEIYQEHILTHTYSSTFAILCLQKLWAIYYYGSSGIDFSGFNIIDNDLKDCSNYELLSLDCFSNNNLKIFSEGGAKSRLEKTEEICQSDITKKFLHVCTVKEKNCNVCPKCMRTILSLYSIIDDIYEYRNVFDIEYFNQNKEKYFDWIYNEHLNKNDMNEPTYQRLLIKDDFKNFVKKRQRERSYITQEQDYYKHEYEKLINSKAYKLCNKVLYIPRKIIKLIKRNNSNK